MLKGNVLISKKAVYAFEDGAKYRIYVRNTAIKGPWKFFKDYTFHKKRGFISESGSKFCNFTTVQGLFRFGNEVFFRSNWCDANMRWRIVKLCH